MSAHRVDLHRIQELVRLHRLGNRSREIARLLKMGRNTLRGYMQDLAAAGLLDGPPDQLPEFEPLKEAVLACRPLVAPPQQVSSLDTWSQLVADMVERGAGPKAVYDALVLADSDYPGSLSAVKRLCLRLSKDKGIQPEDVAIPVTTGFGEDVHGFRMRRNF